jgi:long-chain acyl-CoA synthetase
MTSQKNAATNRPQQNSVSGTGEADHFSKLLLQNREQRGDRPAIREKSRGIWKTRTWREFADEAAALAAALIAQGVQRGAHIVVLGDNRPRLYAAIAAAHALGAVAVPLFQDASAEDLVPFINTAGATHIFAENQEQVDKLLAVLPKIPSVQSIVYDADRGMRHYRQKQLASYASLLEQGRDILANKPDFLDQQAARASGDDPAFVFFTSGATGTAKAAVLTHAGLIARASSVARIEKFRDTDAAVAYLPPGWVAQTLFSYVLPMAVGYCVCCPESSETMVADMREIGPTILLAPPRVLDALLTQISIRIEDSNVLSRGLYRSFMRSAEKAERKKLSGKSASGLFRLLGTPLVFSPLRDIFGLSRVRVAYTTGDAIDPDLVTFFRALGVNLKELYGSTESGFLVAMHRDGNVRSGTVGTAIDGVEIKLSEEREILVRSPGLFTEYRGDKTGTAKARSADGWLRTGDAGYIADDGHLRVVDSLPDVGKLKSGAMFAPRPVENRLKFFPYIREAVVFGDGRDSICALIDMDPSSVARWADRRSISYTGNADLASRDEVYELIGSCIAKLNAELARDTGTAQSQISRFIILPKELSSDDGVLTRTGKPQRPAIARHFKALIDAMYADQADVGFDVDGPGPDADRLKIRDVGTVAPSKSRRAA